MKLKINLEKEIFIENPNANNSKITFVKDSDYLIYLTMEGTKNSKQMHELNKFQSISEFKVINIKDNSLLFGMEKDIYKEYCHFECSRNGKSFAYINQSKQKLVVCPDIFLFKNWLEVDFIQKSDFSVFEDSLVFSDNNQFLLLNDFDDEARYGFIEIFDISNKKFIDKIILPEYGKPRNLKSFKNFKYLLLHYNYDYIQIINSRGAFLRSFIPDNRYDAHLLEFHLDNMALPFSPNYSIVEKEIRQNFKLNGLPPDLGLGFISSDISANGKNLAVLTNSKISECPLILIFDVESGQLINEIFYSFKEINLDTSYGSIAYYNNDKYLVVAARSTLLTYETKSLNLINIFDNMYSSQYCYSNDFKYLAVKVSDNKINIFKTILEQ
jgi:hypothetical protein